MATIKVKFRESTVPGKQGSVFYQICHKGNTCQLSAEIHLFPQYWDKENNCVIKANRLSCPERLMLNAYRLKIKKDEENLRRIITERDATKKDYTLSDLVHDFQSPPKQAGVLAFMKNLSENCRKKQAFGTSRAYYKAVCSFSNFLNGEDLPFSLLTDDLLEEYARWLTANGVVRNTLSFYMRNLRACYNKAVKLNIVPQTYPFKNIYTGVDKTRKRAVSENLIMKMQQLDLTNKDKLAFSRDLFLFSYATRGMSFIDMAFLKKSDICGNNISYVRHKTHQRLNIQLEPCMKAILNRYQSKESDSPYVFPIIHSTDKESAYKEYQVALRTHNSRLKSLGKQYGEKITSYMARHSWATSARNHNVPLAVISAGMGHSSQKTTEIYLADLDNSLINKVNKGLLEKLNKAVSL